ncbi:SusC/RagA family TonB-linked outer membrane protein [Flavobacterium sp. WC2409]|uniref:SusC/RagA family TonB-linked outer membrane protein n=2 Tax=unclassified Flavobacterium TaxID=196869 RepID=A0AB39W979_9FLAO
MKKNSFYKGGSAFWYLIIIGFSLSYTPALANKLLRQNHSLPQQIQINGTITDGINPLTGVTISIKGKAKSTVISDFDGKYTIEATPIDTLVVTFIGFKTATIFINGRKTINIQLLEDITSLQEVRVNAGYYSVKESERTGSIAKITAKDIEKQPINNPLAAMQGRMSGVNITQATGTPGGGFDIQIRGINSIRTDGNAPLYIVDGVPYSSQSLGSVMTSGNILAGSASPLNNINPSDIESMEVLKDADATAIYGSRGSNGVVLITTKKGKQGKTKFDMNTYSSFGKLTRTMDLLNTAQYLSMRKEAFANDGITDYPGYAYDVNGTWDQNRYTNWQKELLGGTANTNNIQTTVSGGNAETQFLLSGTYRNETTVFPGDAKYEKLAFHNSLTHRSIDNRFKMSFTADYATDKNTLPANDLMYQATILAPNAPALYDAQGNLNWKNGTWNNPLSYLEGKYAANTTNLIANTVLSYNILENLEIKTNLGYTDYHISENRTFPSTMYNPAYGLGSEVSTLIINNAKRSSWIIEPQINWKKTVGNSELMLLAGTTFQKQTGQQLAQIGSGFASNSLLHNIAAASYLTITDDQLTIYKYQAFFGRINYNWKSKYIINLTGRRDGSSRFGPGNRFANFGAIGAAWIFSKEAFINNNSFLSFGKLRISYGTSGNDQIGDYQFLDTYEITGNNYNGTIGIKPTRLFNPSFGWETNKKKEAAIDLGFLNDRIFLTTAYFCNRSSNQLVGVPQPGTTGFSSLQANLNATVQNTGLELELRTVNFRKTAFNWTTTLNLTLPKNKLLEFPDLEGSTYANSLVIGKSLSIQKTYHYTGIDPVTGVYQFEDYNGDGKITGPEDRQWIEDTAPQLFGGFGNQLSYKNWVLDFLFQGVKQKGRNYLYTASWIGDFSNQPQAVLNHWPQNGTDAEIQQYTTGANAAALDAYFLYSNSNATISDASYIRLKSISISYTIPKEVTKGGTAKIYLQGQNLLTWTKYKGADPENQSAFYSPPLRQFTFGLNLSF